MRTEVVELLKNQVNKEFYSAYLYLAFSNYYYGMSLDGFGHWFEVQAAEELQHALKFLKFLQDNDIKMKLDAIPRPEADFTGVKEPLEATLKHEKYVTDLINNIYSVARDAKDFRCCQFLDWFVAEQGEEEKSSSELIAKYELFGGDPKGLYLLNNELKGRPQATSTTNAAE